MRHLSAFGLFILLAGCASSTTNYYTQTVQSWRGANMNDLVKRWGPADDRVSGPDGNAVYVYKTESYQAYNTPTSPSIGVNFGQHGTPVITNTTHTNNVWNRGMGLACIAVFIATPQGKILDTRINGNGCYGSEDFAKRMANPTVNVVK